MKLPHRRQFLHLAAGAAVLPAVSRIAWAQTYPARPVRIIVGYCRGWLERHSRPPGRSIAVGAAWPAFRRRESTGCGGNIATEAVVRAPPDGYTLLVVLTANAINATLYDKLNFNLIRDIAPVAGIIRGPYVVVVNPSVPAKTVPEFIAYAKANPGKINMASAGTGTGPHVAGELFKHHERRQHGPCAVPRWRTRADRPARRTSAGLLRISRQGRSATSAPASCRALAVTTAARSELLAGHPDDC